MTIDIQEFTLPGVYRYYAVPKGSSNVYLTAKFEEAEVDQIIDCRADLFVKDIMIGSCKLESKSAAHQYRLSLGKDNEVTGEVMWNVNVEAKSSTEIVFCYSVTYYK